MPSLPLPRLSLVVAACNSMGIGINGRLPWRLKGDMAFFRKLTLKTDDTSKCNAVIMGRKTWDSIPAKFRPLPNRVNIVISRTLPLDCSLSETEEVHVARGLDEALELLSNQRRQDLLQPLVENIYIIGGTSIYEMALNSPYFYRLYLTRVLQDFECDAFLPNIDFSALQEVYVPDIPTELQEDANIKYRYTIYEKCHTNNGSIEGSHQSLSYARNGTQRYTETGPSFPVYISAAVEANMGFGFNGALPWSLRTEFEHFMELATTTVDPGKKVVFIKGRRTWVDSAPREMEHPKVINIVVSRSMCSDSSCLTHVYKIADSLQAAIEAAQQLYDSGTVEKAWIMGGESLYKEAIEFGLCQRIYLTHIKKSYDCDVFFPQFSDYYQEIREKRVECQDEDTGVEMIYSVYERIPSELSTSKQ